MKVRLDSGETIALGTTEAGATIGIVDYSRRVTDAFGVTTVVERGFARRLSVRLAVPFAAVDALQVRMAGLRATTALWIADDRAAWLSARGFYKDFDVDLAVPPLSFCRLTIEGTVETEAVSNPVGDPAPAGRASTLQLLQPASITDVELVSSTVAENDAPAWGAGTSYALGARVVRTHRIFESLVASNAGHDPAVATSQWLDVGPTNRWAMFDQALGTSTTAPGSITVRINAGTIDAVALLDVVGTAVRVEAAGYDRTMAPIGGAATFLDLPLVAGQFTVTILSGGQAAVGTLLVGRRVALGITEAAPSAGITDFSRKEVDDFGEVTVVQRAFAKRMAAKALIRTEAIDLVANRIAAVRARPSLWIGQAGLNSLTVYGFFKDFSIEVGERVSKLSLSVEGLSTAAPVKPLGAAVSWPDIADPDGTKPAPNADVTSENTAKDTAAVAGRPAANVIQVLDRVPALAVAQQLLERSVLDLDGFSRRIDQQKSMLEAALLRIIGEAGYQRTILRDAGILVDPANSKVSFYALEQTREQLTNALIQLDASKAQILTKVDATFVRAEIAAAQLNPADLAALTGIIARVTSAEQRLDGLAARIETKAEAATLTALGGTVQSAVQTLDALAGVVATKVSLTDFNKATARISEVEQKFVALGDVASFSVTVRQAKEIGDQALINTIAGLGAADQAARRQIVAAAEARQEILTRLVDGDAVSAAATLFLSAQLGNTDARLASESLVRAGQTSALAQQTTALGAMLGSLSATVSAQAQALVDEKGARVEDARQIRAEVDADILQLATATEDALTTRIGAEVSNRNQAIATAAASQASATQQVRADFEPRITAAAGAAAAADGKAVDAVAAAGRVDTRVSAQVTRLDQADADERGARASAVQQLRVEAGDALLLVDDRVDAVVDRTGKIEVQRTFAIDAGNNLTGIKAIGGSEGPGSLNLINMDLKMGTGRVIFDNGSFMRVQGVGFGVAGDLISWFGPTMAIGQCSRANAISYETTNGRAYFGGSLAAGIIKNAVQSTNLASDALLATGPLGSNGRKRSIVISYAWDRAVEMGGGNGPAGTGGIAAELRLLRRGAEIATLAVSGTWSRTGFAGGSSSASYTEQMGGSLTLDDTSGGATVDYTLRLVSRSLGPAPTQNIFADGSAQSLSIIETEE